jgi:hypothetical protein
VLKEFLLVIVMWAVTLFAYSANANPYYLNPPQVAFADEEMATPLPWSLRLGGALSVRSSRASILLDVQGGRRFRPGGEDSIVSTHLTMGVRSTPQASDGTPSFFFARAGPALELDLTKFLVHLGAGVEVGADGGALTSGAYATVSFTFLGDLLEARATQHRLWNARAGSYDETTVTLSVNLIEVFRRRSTRGI